MGCVGCSTDTEGGVPKGCGSKGNCATGGCNMLNTYDWLADMPIAFGTEQSFFYEISFQNGSRKDFYKNERNVAVNTGDLVVVETAMGNDIGRITLSGELVKLQMKKKKVKSNSAEIRNIVRFPSEDDLKSWEEAKALEKPTMIRARAIARSMNLEMKIGHVEFQADKKKVTFYYTAEDRIDFRELIKVFAKDFKVKIEMRQIGARQEAGKIGGIGTCGRELCCSTWLTDFKSVSTNAARYQNLSINLSKLSGQCGRLKCCLNYELDTYMDALQEFPKKADKLETDGGIATLMKTDVLQRLMWYTYAESSTFYPLTVEQVHEIIELNKDGKKGLSLGVLSVKIEEAAEAVAADYEDTVGHITLASLEKTGKKKKKKSKGKGRPQGDRPQGDRPQGDRPQGNKPQGERPQSQHRPGEGPVVEGQPRAPRPQGAPQRNRGPRSDGQQNRPQGDRAPRPQGDRPARPQGERPPRPQGDKPQGDRPPRNQGPKPEGQSEGGEGKPQGDKPQGGANRNRNRGGRNRGGNRGPRPEGGGGSGGSTPPPSTPQA